MLRMPRALGLVALLACLAASAGAQSGPTFAPAFSLSADGTKLVVARGGVVAVTEVATGREGGRFVVPRASLEVAVTNDGRYVAWRVDTVQWAGVHDLHTGTVHELLSPVPSLSSWWRAGQPTGLRFTADQSELVLGSPFDPRWQTGTWARLPPLASTDGRREIAWSDDLTIFVTGAERQRATHPARSVRPATRPRRRGAPPPPPESPQDCSRRRRVPGHEIFIGTVHFECVPSEPIPIGPRVTDLFLERRAGPSRALGPLIGEDPYALVSAAGAIVATDARAVWVPAHGLGTRLGPPGARWLALAPEGEPMAIARAGDALQLLRLPSRRPVWRRALTGHTVAARFLGAARVLVTEVGDHSRTHVTVLDLEGREVLSATGVGAPGYVVSADGRTLAVLAAQDEVEVLSVP